MTGESELAAPLHSKPPLNIFRVCKMDGAFHLGWAGLGRAEFLGLWTGKNFLSCLTPSSHNNQLHNATSACCPS